MSACCCEPIEKAARPSARGYKVDPRLQEAFARGIEELTSAVLDDATLSEVRRALEANDYRGAINAVPSFLGTDEHPVTETVVRLFNMALELFRKIYELSANTELERIGSRMRWAIEKAKKPKHQANRFTEVPHSADFIQRQSARLVVEITESQREAIATVLAARFDQQKRPDVLVRQLKDLVGLTSRETQAVLNSEDRARERGVKEQQIQQQSARYAKKLHQARAERIARTETVAVESEARLEAWRTAQDEGTLPETAQQEWVASEDACELCDSLDGQVVGLDEDFSSPEAGEIARPPAHPHCVCMVILRR